MRDWKTSLIYRLLSRHQNNIIVCIYVFGSFLKNRIIAYENYQRVHSQLCRWISRAAGLPLEVYSLIGCWLLQLDSNQWQNSLKPSALPLSYEAIWWDTLEFNQGRCIVTYTVFLSLTTWFSLTKLQENISHIVWSELQDSNLLPSAPKADALPDWAKFRNVAVSWGFEPQYCWLTVRCFTR